MDGLMSRVLVNKHALMFMSAPTVDVAVGHVSVAERALKALKELHPRLRVSAIFRDHLGMMVIDVAYDLPRIVDAHDIISALVDGFPEDLTDKIMAICQDARTLSAWTCQHDGRPGWLVDTPTGATVLCPACQRSKGLEVKRYEA